jgi:hypothetical protein
VEDECVVETQQIPEVETMRRPMVEKPKTNGKEKTDGDEVLEILTLKTGYVYHVMNALVFI